MNKTLQLGILAMASLVALSTEAQTTMTDNNYPRQGTFSHSTAIDESGVTIPTVGSSQSWDYSGLSEETSVTHDHLDATGDPVFTGANNSSVWYYTFQGMQYSANHYEGLDANAWTDEGRKIFGAGYSITATTGGADDSLVFLDYDDVYATPHVKLEFPASFGNAWTSAHERNSPYRLTVVGSGVVDVPGVVREFRTIESEVVGDGSLIIPLSTGGAAPARDVILVKEIITEIDSIFLDGVPAPPSLLAVFGLTQGDITVTTSYSFYTPDLTSELLYVLEPVGSLLTNRAQYSKDADNLGINEIVFSTAAYPNPVAGGSEFSIEFEGSLGDTYVQIVSMNGQVVFEGNVPCNNSHLQLTIPESIQEGMYYITIESTTTLVKPILIQVK